MNFFLKRYESFGHIINPAKIKPRLAIRLNPRVLKVADILKGLNMKKMVLTRIPFLELGYFIEARFALSSTSEYLQGQYYIQEAASQLSVQVLDPRPGETVLDMCAAPGSKTTQIAQYMKNEGVLMALDSNSSRIPALKNNLERCGVKNCLVYQKDAAHADDLGVQFDKVLLDAPCSGNFVADPDWFKKRTIQGIKLMAREQKPLIAGAINVLKPDGILVYSTCSLEPEEDEEIVEWALDTFDVKLESTGLDIGDEGLTERTKLCRRMWPEKTGTQGFFIAKFRLS